MSQVSEGVWRWETPEELRAARGGKPWLKVTADSRGWFVFDKLACPNPFYCDQIPEAAILSERFSTMGEACAALPQIEANRAS